MKKREIIVLIITLAIIITLVSTTLGKEILAGKTPTLTSFALIHFAGYLFFLLMPVEALIPFYIAEGHNAFILFFLAISTAIIAQLIDYLIGRSISEGFIGKFVKKKKLDKAERAIENYGGPIILLFNATPLSSPIVLLAAGLLRYPFKRTMFYSIVGLSLKYAVLIIAALFLF